MAQNQTLNGRGEWVPAIPLPIYGAGQIECHDRTDSSVPCQARWMYLPGGQKRALRRYREHYALVHILGLD